jgi:hypothetical protein
MGKGSSIRGRSIFHSREQTERALVQGSQMTPGLLGVSTGSSAHFAKWLRFPHTRPASLIMSQV